MKTLLALGAILAVGGAFIVGSSVEKDSALVQTIEPTAEAADGCSPTTKGKYALKVGSYGTVPASYDSGPACKLTVCVTKTYQASYFPASCDAGNPSSAAGGCIPPWVIGYKVQNGDAPAGTPTCDAYWNVASRWSAPAQ